MPDFEYTATLDDDQVIQTLRNIDRNIERLGDRGDKHFQQISKSANLSGVQIGAISGVVSSLTTAFIEMGQRAIASFEQAIAKGVETATEFDTLRARLLGIFDGSQPAADAAFDFIQQRSRELGIDLGELAGAFIPKTESLDQFERVAKIAAALAQKDPEQGAVGARIALIEALSGTFTSLQRRFEFSAGEVDRLQQAFDTEGIDGFLTAFEQIQDETGQSFEVFANTAQGSFNRAQESARQLQGALGTPIVEELKEQFAELGGILNERGDDFELIADAFGRVLANVVDFIGSGVTDFLANLDTEQAIELAENLFDMVDNARTLAEVLGLLELPGDLIDGASALVEKLAQASETAVQIGALTRATIARRQAEERVRAEQGNTALGGFVTFAGSPEEEAAQLAAGQEAFNQVIQESLGILEESTKRKEENREATDKLAEAQKESTEAGTEEANAILAEQQRQIELQEALTAGQAAQEKINQETEKIEEQHQTKLFDIRRKAFQKLIDQQRDASEARVDLARKDAQKIEDIERKNEQEIVDAGRDLSREEQDIARKFARERADLARKGTQERVKIEEDFQEELQSIRSRFEQQAEEAERGRDAVAFLRAQRQAEREVEQAKQARNEKVDETRQETREREEELRIRQQREIEDDRIKNERVLEDLQIRLERELEAQRIAREREEEELRISEQRKQEELQRSLERQVLDANLAQSRKLDNLKQKLDAEIAAVRAAEQAKTQIVKRETRRQASELDAIRRQSQEIQNVFANPGTLNAPRRQFGGPLIQGQTAVVGESGPELFTAPASGSILPTSRIGQLPLSPAISNNSNIDNSIRAEVNQSMLDPAQQSAVMRAIARAEAEKLLNNIIKRR